jgi:hypothetical protein
LYFLYTGHVRPAANAQELLAVGAMYEIQELVDYSVQVTGLEMTVFQRILVER